MHRQNLSARCSCVGWEGRGYRGWRLRAPLRESDGENLSALDFSGKANPFLAPNDFFAAKSELKKISIDTPLLKRLGMNMEDYYYDAEFLYQKRKEDILNTISLGQIIQVRSTGTMIGNRRVWQVRYLTGASRTEKTVSILNNYSLFNQDFAGFLSAVRAANPEAEVEKMTRLRL
ncbi:hypothetical protein [Pantoea allii]|uniref:hypothetical protein n=1 Tax=Pantoea allii TaxID=574096 RepID=UPI003D31F370